MSKPRNPRTFFLVLGTALLIASLGGIYFGWAQVDTEILLVLTFHGVLDQPEKPWETRYEDLVGFIRGLKRYGFEALDPAEFPGWWQGVRRGGRRFLLTFDDGLNSSGAAMERLFHEEGVRSLLFVVTDLVGQPGYLSEENLQRLASTTGCRFGLHGKTHEEPPKVIQAGRDLAAELVFARSALERIGSQPIGIYAYPFGEFDEASRRAVASAGLQFGFTIESRAVRREDDALLLPRLMYLRGVEQVGEPTIVDWMPPQEARRGGLTMTLGFFVGLLALRMFVRASEVGRPPQKK